MRSTLQTKDLKMQEMRLKENELKADNRKLAVIVS